MNNKPVYDEIIVCLFDGDYHIGLAALTNSLEQFGFKGLVNVAYRSVIPPWVSQLKFMGNDYFYLTDDITIHFAQVVTDMHLGYYKPYFIKQTFDSYPLTNKVFYFDVDIILNAPWEIFSNWLNTGVCVCLDNNFHFIHHSHPWRKDWLALDTFDQKNYSDINLYFNSGYLGVSRQNIILIDRWKNLTEIYKKSGGNIKSFETKSYLSFKGDQDLLNAAITVSGDVELNVMGKEGMGFSLPATLMAHEIGHIKPWEKFFLKT